MIELLLACLATCAQDHLKCGLTLAHAGRLEEARQALEAGQRNAPLDKRFPQELAGLAYRRKDLPEARRNLRKALKLDPQDRYANDFLGTLYFLDQNVEAALGYWNRIGKPRIGEVYSETAANIDPVLLDRAFAFSPASVLLLDDYRATVARLDALDLFRRVGIEVTAESEESFGARLRALEHSRPARAIAVAQGLPYQTLHLDFYNLRGAGVNWKNTLRWDAQKRRVRTSLAAPLRRNPKWRYELFADGRKETWNLGTAEDFRLVKAEAGAEILATASGRTTWHTGVSVAQRRFRNAPEFQEGLSMKYRASVDHELMRIPERRFSLGSGLSWELGRLFSESGGRFSRMQGSLSARWLPQARGSGYEMTATARVGSAQGRTPFDEMFILGLERDNDLWLRGHAGTREGKKGSAPVGRNYFLVNWELDREVVRRPLFALHVGPFVDAGRLSGRIRQSGPTKTLLDAGAQCKLGVLGAMRVTVSYGMDLRSGGEAFYVAIAR